MIDLHAHTTASDGTLTPAQLMRHAADLGLSAVAITDHDTLEGLSEARAAGESLGVEVVPGIEISLDYKGPKTAGRSGWMHLLVYFIDPHGSLASELADLKRWRAERNGRMIGKLNELGVDITLDEIAAVSGGGQIGRPHFAAVLIEKGYVDNRQQAFDRYLAKGSPAYEDKRRLAPREAISKARAEGALPVLAHPFSLGLDDDKLREKLAEWKSMGLCGLEVIYPEHDDNYRARLAGLARDLDLVETGGSDFHGANKPEIELGRGIDGNVGVADSVLVRLNVLRKESRP
ncbi:MAG TPA: PHP domain-containing protein [Myxococcota bacterium]|nr:PHP domain-containing protein [Myxococcota bacterium]